VLAIFKGKFSDFNFWPEELSNHILDLEHLGVETLKQS